MDIEKDEMEAVVIFESLISGYLELSASTGTLQMHRQKLKLLAKWNEMVSTIRVAEDGKAQIAPAGLGLRQTVRLLTEVFDGLVEVSSFSKGHEEAMREAGDLAKGVLKRFGTRPAELGIRELILRGYLSATSHFGIEGSDGLMPAGVLKGSMLLLEGAACAERDMIGVGFVKGGLERGEAVEVVLSSRSPDAFRKSLAELGLKTAGYESKKLLRIVDWFSHRERQVVGVEEANGVFHSSKDLTNLGIAIERAAKSLSFAPSRRALVDVIDSTEGVATPQATVEFVQKISGLMKESRFTALWQVDAVSAHANVSAALRQSADGTLAIQEADGGRRELAVKDLRGSKAVKQSMSIKLSRKGIKLEGSRADHGELLAELESIPGVSGKSASALLEAGILGMEQLEKASTEALAGVPGIGETLARGIHDYLRSVEYAKRMLLRRSAVWVKQGKSRSADGDAPKAIEAFKRAIEIAPDNAEAWYELGAKLHDMKELEEAKRCFERAVSIDGIYADEWYGGDGYTPEVKFKCGTCSEPIETDTTRCPHCGVPLTFDERRRLSEILRGSG
ncbi:MAG: tetratricopeptide repeat protein [Euryarchaeota archaeon]|nr:tetratricopeptide repeat protein [Euryarchaeota archaeon]